MTTMQTATAKHPSISSISMNNLTHHPREKASRKTLWKKNLADVGRLDIQSKSLKDFGKRSSRRWHVHFRNGERKIWAETNKLILAIVRFSPIKKFRFRFGSDSVRIWVQSSPVGMKSPVRFGLSLDHNVWRMPVIMCALLPAFELGWYLGRNGRRNLQ